MLKVLQLHGRVLIHSRHAARSSSHFLDGFHQALTTCKKKAQWELSLILLQRIRSSHGRSREAASCYTAAIVACGRMHQWQRALLLYEHMKENGVHPEDGSCSALISTCAHISAWVRALSLLSTTRHHRLALSTSCLNSSINACTRGIQWQHVLQLLTKTMLTYTIFPDNISFNTAVSACAGAEEWEWAMELLSRMPSKSLRPDAFTLSASISCFHKNSWEIAMAMLDFYHSMSIQINIVAWCSLLHSLLRGGKWYAVLQAFQQVLRSCPSINAVAYTCAFHACEANGHRLVASQLWKEMHSSGTESDVVSHAAAAQASEVYFEHAERVFRRNVYGFLLLNAGRSKQQANSPRTHTRGGACPEETPSRASMVLTRVPDLGPFSRDATEQLQIAGLGTGRCSSKLIAILISDGKSEPIKNAAVFSVAVVDSRSIDERSHAPER